MADRSFGEVRKIMIKGILFSVTASVLFGVVYFLSTVLQPIEGTQLFGIRTLVTLPFVLFAMVLLHKKKEFIAYLKRLKNQPHLLALVAFGGLNMGSQMWLFLYAPVSGKAIEVSIGYLLMPLVMVLFGRLFFRERLTTIKLLAVLFAFIGVLSKVILTGAFSWETAFVCVGYPVYFAIRKHFNMLHISAFTMEMLSMLPVSLYFTSQIDFAFAEIQNPDIYWGLFLLGLVGGTAFILYVTASQILPINLLGLLGYFEPLMMLIVAFIIGERLDQTSYILMACLFVAVGLLILDGVTRTKAKLLY